MYKLCVISLVSLVFLAGCNNNESQDKQSVQDSTAVVSEMATTEETGDDFPVAALAVRPDSESERRENGNSGGGKTYYLSIVANEEIGPCLSRRVEVRGRLPQTVSENWSTGQTTKWEMSSSEVTVEIQEDGTMCRGGQFLVFKGSVMFDDLTFEVDESTYSVRFYADVPVYFIGANVRKDVSIVIDATRVAEGDIAGGNISTSKNIEWSKDYDSESGNLFEAVNIVFDGSISVDNFVVQGIIKSRLSRSVSNYNSNGTRPIDPFIKQMPTVGGSGGGSIKG